MHTYTHKVLAPPAYGVSLSSPAFFSLSLSLHFFYVCIFVRRAYSNAIISLCLAFFFSSSLSTFLSFTYARICSMYACPNFVFVAVAFSYSLHTTMATLELRDEILLKKKRRRRRRKNVRVHAYT